MRRAVRRRRDTGLNRGLDDIADGGDGLNRTDRFDRGRDRFAGRPARARHAATAARRPAARMRDTGGQIKPQQLVQIQLERLPGGLIGAGDEGRVARGVKRRTAGSVRNRDLSDAFGGVGPVSRTEQDGRRASTCRRSRPVDDRAADGNGRGRRAWTSMSDGLLAGDLAGHETERALGDTEQAASFPAPVAGS